MKYIYILLLVIKEIYLYVAFLLTTGGRGFAECFYTRQRALCTRQTALPSVAFGKVRSAKFFSAKGLCRVLFIGALGKI